MARLPRIVSASSCPPSSPRTAPHLAPVQQRPAQNRTAAAGIRTMQRWWEGARRSSLIRGGAAPIDDEPIPKSERHETVMLPFAAVAGTRPAAGTPAPWPQGRQSGPSQPAWTSDAARAGDGFAPAAAGAAIGGKLPYCHAFRAAQRGSGGREVVRMRWQGKAVDRAIPSLGGSVTIPASIVRRNGREYTRPCEGTGLLEVHVCVMFHS